MIALVGSLAHAFSSSCVTKAVSLLAHLAESASCRRGNVSLEFHRLYKYLLPTSLWSKTKSWTFLSRRSNGWKVDSGNISFPLGRNFWLDMHSIIAIRSNDGKWKISKFIQNQVFETGTWPSNAEKHPITSNDHLLKWTHIDNTTVILPVETECIWGTLLGPSQCWPLSKTQQSRWDLSDHNEKAHQMLHSAWPRKTNKQISKDLQGIFEISLKQCIVGPKPPQKKRSFECEPLSTLFSLMIFVKRWHRMASMRLFSRFFPTCHRNKTPQLLIGLKMSHA